MADYYPLIARAIASLGPDSTPALRSEMYERATNALINQLRSLEPPMAEADIERERVALEAAVRQVEQEARKAAEPPPPPPAPSPPPPPPPPQSFAPPRQPERTVEPPPPSPPPPSRAERHPEPRDVPREPDPFDDDRSSRQPAEPVRYEPAEAAPGEPFFDELPAEPDFAPQEPPQPRHPQAPRPEVKDRSWIRGAVVAGGIAVVVAITAYAAWRLRDKASNYSRVATQTEQQQKYTDRIGENGPVEGDTAPAPNPPPPQPEAAQAPAAPAQPAPAPQPQLVPAAPPPSGGIGVFQRAALIEEPTEPGGQPRATSGKVSWQLETVPGGEGGVVDNAVHASVDLGDAGLKADLMLRKNRDPALPASHTLEVRFTTTDKSANGKVRDMTVPEMRTEEGQRGTPLAGLPVPVMENLVLVGLSNLPADVERNIDLLKTRNWMSMVLRYANGKRALLVFEKGAPGDRVLQDALQAWKQ
jgi:hypothetical protein